jgi:hypothetical protein
MRTKFHSVHDLLYQFRRATGQDRDDMEFLVRRVIDHNGGVPLVDGGDIFMKSHSPGRPVVHIVGHDLRMVELPECMKAEDYVEYGPELYAGPA